MQSFHYPSVWSMWMWSNIEWTVSSNTNTLHDSAIWHRHEITNGTPRYLPSFPAATACRLIPYRKTKRQHRVDSPGRHSNLRSCHLPRELMQPTVPLGQKECLSRVQMTTAFNVITGFWLLPPEHVFVVPNHTAVDACVW